MANSVLGLQGGVADGSEPTFDGQPIQPRVHLRWGFAPELGFPSGGFWLCRRITKGDEKRIPPPPSAQKAIDQQANPTAFSPRRRQSVAGGLGAELPCITLDGTAVTDTVDLGIIQLGPVRIRQFPGRSFPVDPPVLQLQREG